MRKVTGRSVTSRRRGWSGKGRDGTLWGSKRSPCLGVGSGYLGVYVGKKHQTGYQTVYSVHSVCGLALNLKNVGKTKKNVENKTHNQSGWTSLHPDWQWVCHWESEPFHCVCLGSVEWCPSVFICISLVVGECRHLEIGLLDICASTPVNGPFPSFVYFSICLTVEVPTYFGN